MKKILVKTLFVLAYSFEKVKGHYQVVVVFFFFTIECFANYFKAFSTTIAYIQVHSVSGQYIEDLNLLMHFQMFLFSSSSK